ncbi:Fur family transcriptional regulator [Candidatus Laterigemmans baculatus]|uniref:Fur family transcriptional regulator n=1 Tax=Candidatus Laterigemmans baculatus TaxID=2770505 RepID=UPI0013DCE77C|nr:transcriptional repressor [Candidatus Laterigemmans baculatus]
MNDANAAGGRQPASPSEARSAAREDIRARGLRATPARIAALVEIRRAAAPLTHAELAERLAASGVDKATAFRNLNDLAGAGLLRRSELGDHLWRFEATDPQQEEGEGHPHFLCVDCGSVTCLGDVQLTAGSRRRSAAVGTITEILLRGYCHDCGPAAG